MSGKKTRKPLKTSREAPQQESFNCYEGDRLVDLLSKLGRSIEATKLSKKDQLPDKIWLKQQFSIGANDVTRVLERMRPGEKEEHSAEECSDGLLRRAPLVPLQAVILASDCIPRSLIKHIPSLASSRKVPVILVKDNKRGSLRLGELLKLKTATAIGVKARGSSINTAIDELL